MPSPLPGQSSHALDSAIRTVYEPAGMQIADGPRSEAESGDYGAACFCLNGRQVAFRVAKTTPKKVGHFVTLWKRPNPGDDIAPLDGDDGVDFVIVHVEDETNTGQFIFSRATLLTKGIMSQNGVGGKRATRIYAPWVQPSVRSALAAQKWQLNSFLEFPNQGAVDLRRANELLAH